MSSVAERVATVVLFWGGSVCLIWETVFVQSYSPVILFLAAFCVFAGFSLWASR